MTGEHVTVEKADQYADASRIVVASVQTLRPDRLKRRFARDAFGLIAFDEAHHAVSKGARVIFEYFNEAKIIGMTATPRRLDKVGMHNSFETVAFQRDIVWAIAEGYFVPPVPISRMVDSIDLAGIKTQAGDLALGALETEVAKSAAAIAKIAFEECGDRPAIVYTPGRASAHAVADTLNQLRAGCAVSVDSETPKAARWHARKKLGSAHQFISNCQIYGEGLDVPQARAIVIARPTESEALYTQFAGRGGRPEGWIGQLETAAERVAAIAASGKPDFLLLDITGKPGRHSLVTAADALAGNELPEVRERAAKIARTNKKKTLGQAISQAKSELEAEEEASKAAIAKAAAAAEVKARRGTFDAFRRFGVADDELDHGEAPKWAREPATPKQVAWLRDNGLKWKDVTKGVADALYAKAKEWRRLGLASFRQRSRLHTMGCPVDVPSVVASRLIEAQNAIGGYGKKLPTETVRTILNQGRDPGEEG